MPPAPEESVRAGLWMGFTGWNSQGFTVWTKTVCSVILEAEGKRKEKLMPQAANYSLLARRRIMASLRELIWIQERHFQGWGCSECAWVFRPSGPPTGNSLQEMKENYLRLRDEESAAHVCAEHPSAKKARVQMFRAIPLRTSRMARITA
jgi:hypothetical protein